MRYARAATYKMQMSQIALALEQYKIKYGEYPPDWSDADAVVRHVKKRWPRFQWNTTSTDPIDQYKEFCERIYAATGWNAAEMGATNGSPAVSSPPSSSTPKTLTGGQQNFAFGSALVFWLGGLREDSSTSATVFERLDGFSTNPENPFDVGSGKQREKPFAEFEVGKNLAVVSLTPATPADIFPAVWLGNGMVAYFKANPSSMTEQYAYYQPDNSTPATNDVVRPYSNNDTADIKSLGFAAGAKYKFSHNTSANFVEFEQVGIAVPYMKDGILRTTTPPNVGDYPVINANTAKWYVPKGFQLVHPGLDGKFDAANVKRDPVLSGNNSGTNVTQFDLDNIIYIGEAMTVQEAMP